MPITPDRSIAKKDILKEVQGLDDHRGRRFLCRYLPTIAPWAVTLLVGFMYPSRGIFVVLAVLAGLTQNALVILMHEGSHWFFHHTKSTNDLLANILVCLPILNTVEGYRHSHLMHHQHVGHPSDPYFRLYDQYASKRELLKYLCLDITGITAVRLFYERYLTPTEASPKMFGVLLALFVLIQSALFVLLWRLTGTVLGYCFIWVIPLMTIPFAINRIRTIAEHCSRAGIANRSTLVNMVEYCLIAPYGYNFHYEHHLLPTIPYYRLAWVHQRLMDSGHNFDATTLNKTGYLSAFREYLASLPW